jgi:hypothetical protein
MKKFTFATLAALALVAVAEQQAKAWFNATLGGSFNTSLSWGGHKHGCGESEPWPGQSFGNPGYNNYGVSQPNYPPPYMGGGNHFVPPPPTPQGSGSGSAYYYAVPMYQAMPYAQATYQPAMYQQAAYYYQVPSYWYGR